MIILQQNTTPPQPLKTFQFITRGMPTVSCNPLFSLFFKEEEERKKKKEKKSVKKTTVITVRTHAYQFRFYCVQNLFGTSSLFFLTNTSQTHGKYNFKKQQQQNNNNKTISNEDYTGYVLIHREILVSDSQVYDQ